MAFAAIPVLLLRREANAQHAAAEEMNALAGANTNNLRAMDSIVNRVMTKAEEKEPAKATRMSANPAAVAVLLLHRLKRSVKRQQGYRDFCCYVFLTLLLLLALLTTFDPAASSVNQSITKSLLFGVENKSPLVEIDSSGIAGTVTETQMKKWLTEVVTDLFVEPTCGDGVCEDPVEFPSWLSHGCLADCGTYTNTTNVYIHLDYQSTGKGGPSNSLQWNLCSSTYTAICAFDVDQDTGSGTGELNEVVPLPDGDWGIKIHFQGNVGGVLYTDPTALNFTTTEPGYFPDDTEGMLAQWKKCDGPSGSTYMQWYTFENLDSPSAAAAAAAGSQHDFDDDEEFWWRRMSVVEANEEAMANAAEERERLSPRRVHAVDDMGYGRHLAPGAPPEPECSHECREDFGGNGRCDDECDSELCDYDNYDCCDTYFDTAAVVTFPLYEFFQKGNDTGIFSPLTSHRLRYIGERNSVIAGLYLNQERWGRSSCAPTRFPAFKIPCSSSTQSQDSFGVDPAYVTTSELYAEGAVANGPPPGEEVNSKGVPYGFKHLANDDHGEQSGFPVLFDINLSKTQASRVLTYVNDGSYFDELTKKLQVQVMTYNAENDLFALTTITFDFLKSGLLSLSTDIQVLPVDLPESEEVQFTFQIILLIATIWFTVGTLVRMFTAFRKKRLVDHFMQARTWGDLATSACLLAVVISLVILHEGHIRSFTFRPRYAVYGSHMFTTKTQPGPGMLVATKGSLLQITGLYAASLEMAAAHAIYINTAGITVMIMLVGLLQRLHFQPRLGLLTRTLQKCTGELAHFSILFFLVIFGYALAGMLMFGAADSGFYTFFNSFVTCLELLLGESGGLTHRLADITNSFIALVWVWSFVFVVVFILISVLLAILVEAYMEVKQSALQEGSLTEEVVYMVKEGLRGMRTKSQRRKDAQVAAMTELPIRSENDPEAAQLPKNMWKGHLPTDAALLKMLVKRLKGDPKLWNQIPVRALQSIDRYCPEAQATADVQVTEKNPEIVVSLSELTKLSTASLMLLLNGSAVASARHLNTMRRAIGAGAGAGEGAGEEEVIDHDNPLHITGPDAAARLAIAQALVAKLGEPLEFNHDDDE